MVKPLVEDDGCSSIDDASTVEDDDDVQTLPSTTLEKWARMAEKLKGKLDDKQRENANLKDQLRRKTNQIKDLKGEHVFFTERIFDLEFQCLEKSAKIAKLTEVIDCQGHSNELQEKLLKNSMEHAEMSLSVDRLRLQLQKCEAENEELTKVNKDLSRKVEDIAAAWNQGRKEQERNRTLLIEMGDVVRTLNCVTVEFEKETAHGGADRSAQPNPFQNIKRKIQAMEEDRQRLIRECESLRQDNNSKHQRIEALETQFRSYSASRTEDSTEVSSVVGPLDAPLETQTSPVSIDTRILDQGDQSSSRWQKPLNEYSRLACAASEVSSFSDLDAPEVSVTEHETLKKYYEEALARIIRMSGELSKTKKLANDLHEKDTYISELKERLECMRFERDELRQANEKLDLHEKDTYISELKERLECMRLERDEMRQANEKLEQDLKEALALAETATSNHMDVLTAHEAQKKEYLALKEKYDNIEAEYSKQLTELEAQVTETEKFFGIQCEALKQQHLDKMAVEAKKLEKLEKETEAALEAEMAKYKELNEEFDLFMEMHTQLEDDMATLKEKYDQALTNTVELEERFEQTKKKSAEEKVKLEMRLDAQSKAIVDLKASVEKSKAEMQEVVVQHQKLRRENDAILAKHGELVPQLAEAKKQKQLDKATIDGLRENCCDMEERLKRAENTASVQFKNIQASYDTAISKIETLLMRLKAAGLAIGDEETAKQGSESNERINRLERELMGDNGSSVNSSKLDQMNDRFVHDFSRVLKKVTEAKMRHARHAFEQVVWYDRPIHQIRLNRIHQSLMERMPSNGIGSAESHGGPKVKGETRLQSNDNARALPTNETVDSDDESSSIVPPPVFLKHQRRMNVVHDDVLAVSSLSKDLSASPESPRKVEGNSQGPDNIDDANSVVRKLKGETHKIRMEANTAKIRHEAREKELRVVRLQYQKLLEEYNTAVKNSKGKIEDLPDSVHSSPSSPTNKVKMTVQRMELESEVQRLEKALRDAELKMERMVMELRATKSKAEVAQRKHEEGEKHLQDAIGHHEHLEARLSMERTTEAHETPFALSESHLIHNSIFRSKEDLIPEERRQEESGCSQGDGENQPAVSFDGSFLTSVRGLSHEGGEGEGRDGQWEEGKGQQQQQVQFEGGIGGYLQLQQDHDKALRTIDQLKADLAEAERSAENAREQLKSREEDLRSVIRDYNQIKEECDRLFNLIQDKVKEEEGVTNDEKKDDDEGSTTTTKSAHDEASSKDDLVRERNMALGKISLLETELEKAQAAAKAARKKQLLREDHLRQVIDQYKALNKEHTETKEQLAELQRARRSFSRDDSTTRTTHRGVSTSPGMESRSGSHEESLMDGRARDQEDRQPQHRLVGASDSSSHQSSKTSQKSKTKRKPWFRDLGGYVKKEVRHLST